MPELTEENKRNVLDGGDDDDDDDSLVSEEMSQASASSAQRSSTKGGRSDTADESDSKQKNMREVQKHTRRETKRVETWRELVTGVMVITASFVSTTTFIYLNREEVQSFANAYNKIVVTIGENSKEMEDDIYDGMDIISADFIGHTMTSTEAWPFVTVPNFEVFATQARETAYVSELSFCPLIFEYDQLNWETYSVANQGWLESSTSIPAQIYQLDDHGEPEPVSGLGPYAPRWQTSPTPENPDVINYDVGSKHEGLLFSMVKANGPVISEAFIVQSGTTQETRKLTEYEHEESFVEPAGGSPQSTMFYPVRSTFEANSSYAIVALLEVTIKWGIDLGRLLPYGVNDVVYVLQSSCGSVYSYENTPHGLIYLGEGDLHDEYYNYLGRDIPIFREGMGDVNETAAAEEGYCMYTLTVYPTYELRKTYMSPVPSIFTAVIAATFFVMAMFFFSYDKYVQRRNKKVMRQAAATNAIVASMFPSNVRDRLLRGNESDKGKDKKRNSYMSSGHGRKRLRSFLSDGDKESENNDQPIADLFPHCTVMFADLAGFTAWSSMREPSQVFRLLETIYQAFDAIAKRRRVFKVETIGDCYVAVTGLPEPRRDHAIVMAKFARDCMFKVNELTKKLEETLGPDTGDLAMRFGLHSGPVTAGVLRGERSRFQLFGDTVNTAARMEQSGKPGFIHLSQETADEIKASRSVWVIPREDNVVVKGKGQMTTFWLSLAENSSDNKSSSHYSECSEDFHARESMPVSALQLKLPDKAKRLVEWNVDVLSKILKSIIAQRKIMAKSSIRGSVKIPVLSSSHGSGPMKPTTMVLDEVAEVITLPKFNSRTAKTIEKAEGVKIPPKVLSQLRNYIATIASLYQDNSFHNFEHASHVTMSVVKLLSRIVAPEIDIDEGQTNEKKAIQNMASKLHDHTFGITSDPLTQFAVIFSALIHDVDHPGVPNTQLGVERIDLAEKYNSKSIAEQNSVDIAWALLMQPDYSELRAAICETECEYKRFRQLVVNAVMSTDIMDKELKELRNARWNKAFHKGDENQAVKEDRDTDVNRKATIVIEHLIQASDVSHTMQHWHIYRKWNERFFREMYTAYKTGRAEKDPSEFWYKGEIGFFEFYIIPLAKKLADCGVFGVSSDEYLQYAQKNLEEWKEKGEGAVQEMIDRVHAEYDTILDEHVV